MNRRRYAASPDAPPDLQAARAVRELSADLHWREGRDAQRDEHRDQLLGDLLTVSWPTETAQYQ